MNDYINSWVFWPSIWLLLMILALCFFPRKTKEEQAEDDAQQIRDLSIPAPLDQRYRESAE